VSTAKEHNDRALKFHIGYTTIYFHPETNDIEEAQRYLREARSLVEDASAAVTTYNRVNCTRILQFALVDGTHSGACPNPREYIDARDAYLESCRDLAAAYIASEQAKHFLLAAKQLYDRLSALGESA
jgi:hypothetical protein